MLTKDQILAAPLPFEDVDAPTWGGKIRLRMMSGALFAEWMNGRPEQESAQMACARIIAYSAVDESGALLFTADDIPALLERDFDTLLDVGGVAMRINKSRGEDVVAEEKKSDPSQAEGSSSASA